jgi:hypothetical protein
MEPDTNSIDPKLVGIRGWLVVPAIWIGLNSILGGVLFSISLVNNFNVTISVEYIVVLGLWVLLLYIAILFFGKNSKAPFIIIIFLIANIAGSLLLLAIEWGTGADMSASENRAQLVRDIIIAAVWIPYFRSSKRVKATFIN